MAASQEVDMTNAVKTDTEDLFYTGYDGSSSYRIPSLLKTSKGTVLAAIDKRNSGSQDCGNIVFLLEEEKQGKMILVTNYCYRLISNQNSPSSSSFLIDSSMFEDKETGTYFLDGRYVPRNIWINGY